MDLHKVDFTKNYLVNSQNIEMEYIYKGYFSDEVVNHILQIVERQLESSCENFTIRKRAYNLMVEGLQNITRHQISKEVGSNYDGIFCIRKQFNKYSISTGNLVQSEEVDKLKKLLDQINKMDKLELKSYYQELLNNGTFSKKGGAGIGLVDMARKSGQKLNYQFVDIDEESKFFFLKMSLTTEDDEEHLDKNLLDQSFTEMSELYNHLMKENIMILLRGVYDLEDVGDIVESIKTSKVKTKQKQTKIILSLMYEMLVNITHNSADISKLDGIPGIFLMSKSDKRDHLLFTLGNLIPNEQDSLIKPQIEDLIEFEYDNLDRYFLKSQLFENGLIKTGQELIEFGENTKNKLNLHFEKIQPNYSLLTLKMNLENTEKTEI